LRFNSSPIASRSTEDCAEAAAETQTNRTPKAGLAT
jgi:hypothetical protein